MAIKTEGLDITLEPITPVAPYTGVAWQLVRDNNPLGKPLDYDTAMLVKDWLDSVHYQWSDSKQDWEFF